MSFVETANDLHLEDDHVLVGQLQGDDGELHDASIDLNEVIGNNEGVSAVPAACRGRMI
jgi:hypothetical protein